jgi:hypothetical protein
MLNRVVVDGILSIKTPHPFIPALMFHVSTDAAGLPVEHQARRRGTSNYTVLKLLRLFSDLLIHNSSIVLRLVGQAGIAIAGVSFAVAAWVIYRKLVYKIALQGWASLFAALLLIGGMLLFGLGVIGEYLIRIIESSEARPSYFVRRRSRNRLGGHGAGADGTPAVLVPRENRLQHAILIGRGKERRRTATGAAVRSRPRSPAVRDPRREPASHRRLMQRHIMADRLDAGRREVRDQAGAVRREDSSR